MQYTVHPAVHRYSSPAKNNAVKKQTTHDATKAHAIPKLIFQNAIKLTCLCCMLTVCFALLAGKHTGDLEIQYEQGDLVYASLTGQCAEVDVQLSHEVVSLQPTYVNTHSQRCFRSARLELLDTCLRMREEASSWLKCVGTHVAVKLTVRLHSAWLV